MSDLKTPDEWCRVEGVQILDPDGWRGRHGRPWTDRITLAEFQDRLATCTQRQVPKASSDDREPFREARSAGLEKRHERRLENATYTASEVKVLTEAALRLGRKEACEEIADALKARREQARENRERGWPLLSEAWVIARNSISEAVPDASEPRTGPSMGMDLPPEPQAVREPHRALLCGFRDLTRDDMPSCVKPPHSITEPHEWPVGDNR